MTEKPVKPPSLRENLKALVKDFRAPLPPPVPDALKPWSEGGR
jgi:hypothetical protein